MQKIVFNDKYVKPDQKLLREKLGTNFKYWNAIKEYVKNNYENSSEEWKFYGKNYGWQLKTLLKKRNLFFLIPADASFRVVFVFGDKAVSAIDDSAVKEKLKEDIRSAKKYAEGRGLALEVKDDAYLADIKKLIEIKVNN